MYDNNHNRTRKQLHEDIIFKKYLKFIKEIKFFKTFKVSKGAQEGNYLLLSP